MNNDDNRLSREAWIGIILLAVVFFSVVSNLAGLIPLLILAGIAYLVWQNQRGVNSSDAMRQMGDQMREFFQSIQPPAQNQSQRQPRRDNQYPDPRYTPTPTPAAGEERRSRVYKHALAAVQRAGLDANELQVLPVDVGVMAFKGADDPVIYRTWDVPDDVDYVQPFVELRLPTKAVGRVRFELLDAQGKQVYVHEDRHELQRGRNLIIPNTRLPIHDERALNGTWQLRVSADDTLLALHSFGWEEAEDHAIRKHIGEDGELSSELRAVIAEARLGEMSLDELLGESSAEPRQQRRG